MIVDLPRFLARERTHWEALELALQPFERDRFHRPTLEGSLQLFELYQRCAASLARLHEAGRPEVSHYLEDLVARAYAQVHSVPQRARVRPVHWFLQTFPNTFRRQCRAFILALACLTLGSVTGATLLAIDTDAKAVLMPFPHLLTDPKERVKQEERDQGRQLAGHQIAFSATLMANNITVSFLCMALGMTFGLGTVLLVFSNGINLGAVAADYVHGGQTQFLLGWLLPHGVFEIPALLIASQAGFVLASALIGWQSRQSRRQRLRAATGDVFTLLAGSSVMLLWAGLVESFVSQYHQPVLPYSIKIAFGSIELLALAWFLTRYGRVSISRRS